jgi:hypothetical protein
LCRNQLTIVFHTISHHPQHKHTMAAASASSSRTDGISLARIRTASTKWDSQHVTFGFFADEVNKGLIDLFPPHQREVVHTDEWKGQIVISALTTGDIPELYFDRVPHAEFGEIMRSLDGKQRGNAIVQFMNGEISFPKKIDHPELKPLSGKKITDLTPQNQAVIRNLQVHYKVANTKLTNKEVTEFFIKRQATKTTKHGEFLNSDVSSHPRNFIVDEVLGSNALKEVIDTYSRNDKGQLRGFVKRNGLLELLGKCLYHSIHHETNSKIDPSLAVLKKWWESSPSLSEEEKKRFIDTITTTIAFINDYGLKNPGKSVILPIFAYIVKFGKDIYIRRFFATRDSFDDAVGGEHSASMSRYDVLVKNRNAYL